MPSIPTEPLARRAWQAYLRQELTAPVIALVDYVHDIEREVKDTNLSSLIETTRRMSNRASRLLEMVQQLTICDVKPGDDLCEVQQRTIRHDLRASASYIVMACEDLLERSIDEIRGVKANLERTLITARSIIGSVEEMLHFSQSSAEPPSSELMDMIRRLPQAVFTSPPGNRSPISGRILLVDDNTYGRDLVAKMLTNQGHAVEVASSGTEAQVRLQDESRPAVDLILLDVMMPGMTGPELLQWLKNDARFWPIPVIMVSALGEDESVLGCIAAGAEDYLTRPVRAELLRARITGCLEKKRLRDREGEYQARIAGLIRAIFPPAVVTEWETTGTIRPRHHERVGVLFTDIVGFTELCERQQDRPEVIVQMLQDQVNRFEDVVRRHGVQKIKTIGDGFMGVAGLMEPDDNPSLTLLRCALDLIDETKQHPAGWKVRVGVHVGPVVSGVLGKTQFSFDLWGHTVNAAARVESSGRPGRVTLSDTAWQALNGMAFGEERQVVARGIGLMTVWDFEKWSDSNRQSAGGT